MNNEPFPVYGIGLRKMVPTTGMCHDFAVFVQLADGEQVDVIHSQDLQDDAHMRRTIAAEGLRAKTHGLTEKEMVDWLSDQAYIAEGREGAVPQGGLELARKLRRAVEIISTLRDDLEQAGVPDPRHEYVDKGEGLVGHVRDTDPDEDAFVSHADAKRFAADAARHAGMIPPAPDSRYLRVNHITSDRRQVVATLEGSEPLPKGMEEGDVVQMMMMWPKITPAIPDVPAGGAMDMRGVWNPNTPDVHLDVGPSGIGPSVHGEVPEASDPVAAWQAVQDRVGGRYAGTAVGSDPAETPSDAEIAPHRPHGSFLFSGSVSGRSGGVVLIHPHTGQAPVPRAGERVVVFRDDPEYVLATATDEEIKADEGLGPGVYAAVVRDKGVPTYVKIKVPRHAWVAMRTGDQIVIRLPENVVARVRKLEQEEEDDE